MRRSTTTATTATTARPTEVSDPSPAPAHPVVLAVSGASGQPLAERALQLLLQADVPVELVVSRGAIQVWQAELGITVPGDPASQIGRAHV